jgi:hypothetical protein
MMEPNERHVSAGRTPRAFAGEKVILLLTAQAQIEWLALVSVDARFDDSGGTHIW